MSWFRSAIATGVLTLAVSISTADAVELTYDLTIANGQVPENMRLIHVRRNDVVKLEWHTDKPITLHLHGYDIMVAVAPGAAAEMRFTASATGRFTIEPHLGMAETGAHVHGVPLVTVEVYP